MQVTAGVLRLWHECEASRGRAGTWSICSLGRERAESPKSERSYGLGRSCKQPLPKPL